MATWNQFENQCQTKLNENWEVKQLLNIFKVSAHQISNTKTQFITFPDATYALSSKDLVSKLF